MAGVIFIINVPKKQYEDELKNNKTNINFEREKFEKASTLINELKEKQCNQNQTVNDGKMTKCKSTDSIQCHSDLYLHKTKGEINLADGYMDSRSYGKMWDIKQVLKRKNKLIINKPVRGVDILGAFHWDTPLETILSDVVSRLDIRNVAWNSTKDDHFWQVIFSLESGNLAEEVLLVLRTFGIGCKYQSSVSLVPCALYYKSNDLDSGPTSAADDTKALNGNANTWARFSSSVRARTNLAQVLHDVRAGAAFTFDWVFLLLVAALVAAIGLIENSTVILVASMLISPLMSPITAGTLGTAVRDRSLQRIGVLHEFLGLFLCLGVGFVFGLTISIVDERYGVVDDWPTHEMITRCEYRSLWVGILVAIPTGAGVALAVLGEYTSSLVGVAISASLLPPAVNAGLLWAMAFVRLITPNQTRSVAMEPEDLAMLGSVSLCLTLVNIACIFLSGVAVYKVKEVSPLESQDISWWRANRNRLQQTTKDIQKDTSPSLNWDIYNKWCSETLGGRQEADKKSASPAHVDSDTVTFRRRASVVTRLRAQHIENYCLRNAPTGDSYVPLGSNTIDQRTHNDYISTSSDATLNSSDSISNPERLENSTNLEDSETKSHSYYDMGSCIDEEKKQHPTIAPSLSFTMDSRKYGVILGNKTIDV